MAHASLLILLIVLFDLAASDPTVHVRGLGTIRGIQKHITLLDKPDSETPVDFFVAPFAKPPTDDLRFKPPVPISPWSKTLETSAKSKACYHEKDVSFKNFTGSEMWNSPSRSEDCLYLNIWRRAPRRPSNELKTVMVWIFGGGFFSGSPSLPFYNGSVLAAEHDVIVVNINYRVSAFGFLYLGSEEAPGNMGLLDQQLALKWVYEHIKDFGGDRGKITIFGESAGAASTSAHLVAPDSRKYVNNVILQSGSMLAPWACKPKSTILKMAQTLSAALGCGSAMNAGEKRDAARCMRNVAVEEFSAKAAAAMDGFMNFGFVPICEDDRFFKGDVRKLIREGDFKKVPTIAGIVKDEGSFWLFYYLKKYYKLRGDDSASQMSRTDFFDAVEIAFKRDLRQVFISAVSHHYDELLLKRPRADQCLDRISANDDYRDLISQAVGDYHFVCNALYFSSQVALHAPVYLYYFKAISSTNPWPKWAGAMHGYEIEYQFGLPLTDPRYSHSERLLAREMMEYFTHFAKTAQPTNDSKAARWPASNERRNFKIFSTDKKAAKEVFEEDIKREECTVWDQIDDIKYSLSQLENGQAKTILSPLISATLPVILIYVMPRLA